MRVAECEAEVSWEEGGLYRSVDFIPLLMKGSGGLLSRRLTRCGLI